MRKWVLFALMVGGYCTYKWGFTLEALLWAQGTIFGSVAVVYVAFRIKKRFWK